MDVYKSMYYMLFNRMTEAIALLQQAQRDAEEMYLSAEPEQPAEDDRLKRAL